MALTATLALDIKAFEGGLSRATASLDGFAQKTVKNTNRDLARMLEEFTGQRVVAESARMAEAVERIGGASRLTETEQRRVNATVTEAIAKYEALGQQAPDNLVKLQAATTQVEQKTSLLSTAAGKMVAAFSVAAVANVANKILDLTGKLTDLQGKTGINTTGLQVMNYTLGQSGVSLEQAARAAVEMSKRLVGGEGGVVDAVGALRLNVADLIASGPEQAFYSIGQAIASVPDPMQRAALATEIFGKTGADLLPAFTTDMRALSEEALKSAAVIGADLVAAGDKAGDSLHRLQGVGLGLLANVFLPMAPGIEAIANWLAGALTSSLETARGRIDDLIAAGLRMDLWLAETAGSITATVAAVPVLGQVFGQTSGDVEYFRDRAQHARDALAAFTAEGAQPAAAAVAAAAPVTKVYADELERVSASGIRVAASIVETLGPTQEQANLQSRTLQETGKLTKELERWAQANGAVVPTIRMVSGALSEQQPLLATANQQWIGFSGSVQQNTAAAGASTGGFMDKLKGLFGGGQGGSQLSNMLQTVGPQFAASFLGPGSASDKLKAFATQGMGALLGMVPGVGPWLQAFSGPIVEGLSKLAAKGKEILASMFGGPSASEREGRASVAEFEQGLWETLDATQALEAGGENWKKTVIAIRDAYIKAGRTEEEALQAAERLWKSSTISAEESRKVIAEIEAAMKGLPDRKSIDVDVNYTTNQPTPPGGGGAGSNSIINPAMDARVTPHAGSAGVSSIRVPVYIDGREVAVATVPYLAGAMRARGV